MFNPTQLLASLKNITTQQLWVGFSGGLDSTVLLHALVTLINNRQLRIALTQLHAIHINHGWSLQASDWEKHCQQLCQQLNINYQIMAINAKPVTGQSPEACARAARYTAFASFIKKEDFLLTAHQQDDQAETLFLQLLRGAGVKGLASMPAVAPFADGWHSRPLLNCSRADLLNYAKQQKLKWLEDESNADTRYTRNFLRHTIFPALQQRWPEVNNTIARAAQHCAEAAALTDELAAEDLKKLQDKYPFILACENLLSLSELRKKNVLRYWLTQLNNAAPSAAQLQHILTDILYSKKDACPKIILQDKILQRYQNKLYLTPHLNLHDSNAVYTWNLTDVLSIPHIGTLKAVLTANAGLRTDIASLGQLTIRFRQSGERCHPAGRRGSHPLKKLLQEWRVSPWQRDQVPLLYCGNQLAAVIGYCICEPFAAPAATAGWRIELTQENHELSPAK